MNITSSYAVEILNKSRKTFQPTIDIYRSAISYIIDVCETEWPAISSLTSKLKQYSFVEHLIHNTKNNKAKYEFDNKFHKMPIYLMRSAVHKAIGSVSSYHANYQNWIDNGQKGKAPKLNPDTHDMPVFYHELMYKPGKIKLFLNNDWVWVNTDFKKTDVEYLLKYWSHAKASAPKLEKRYGKYFLRFSFEEKDIKLTDTPVQNQIICAVDLGLNTDAACSIMNSAGTVLARKFINFPNEKDQLYHVLNRIKKKQRKYGPKNPKGLWQYTSRLNNELAKKIAKTITEFAYVNHTDIIVFEHLDFQGKKKGSKRQKLHHWKKNSIQSLVEHKAHRLGMRISRICARNTSKLAFDGSGIVTRNKNNYSLCTFQTGKRYDCDLNASYNIGARYFIRELLKPLPVKARSLLEAKIPLAKRRISCTLNTLIQLNVQMQLS